MAFHAVSKPRSAPVARGFPLLACALGLVRPGPDWMGFELRATTDRVEDWMKVRSELAVAISEALAAEKIPMK